MAEKVLITGGAGGLGLALARAFHAAGHAIVLLDLVPDALTSELVRDRLSQADAAEGFLLDGYPRNRGQVDDLDAFLTERGTG